MDPLKSNIGAADPQDPNHHKYIRGLRSTEQLLNQFLKTEGGGVGRSREYRRGWVWNFQWNSDDPQPGEREKVRIVNSLMSMGWTFEDAFDHADAGKCDGANCGDPCSVCGSGAYGAPCPDYEFDEESTTRKCPGSKRECSCAP